MGLFKHVRGMLSAVLAFVLAVGLLPAPALAYGAGGAPGDVWSSSEQPVWQRLAGEHRYETMGAIVSKGFSRSDAVVIATGANFPDALSASGLAGLDGAPVLLTGQESLSGEAARMVSILGAKRAVVVGGGAAVSESAVDELRALGLDVSRVQGETRYETALAVFSARDRSFWGDTAIVASGEGFADALSISPYSYAEKAPVFLTGPWGLDESTREAILGAGFSRILLVGGPAVVPSAVEAQLAGVPCTRLAGENRYETSRIVADFCLDAGMDANQMAVANGSNFPDALAGGAFCGKAGSPLLLVADIQASHVQTEEFFDGLTSGVSVGYVLGGVSAVSEGVVARVSSLAAALADNVIDIDPAYDNVVDYKDDVTVVDDAVYSADAGGTSVLLDAASAEGVEPGDTLVLQPTGDNPEGLAIEVEAVSGQGDGVLLEGTSPEAAELFDGLDLEGASLSLASFEPSSEEGVDVSYSEPAPAARAGFDGEIDSGTFTASVSKDFGGGVALEANVSFRTAIDYKLKYSLFSGVERFYIAGRFEVGAGASVSWSGGIGAKDTSVKLGDASFATNVPGLFVKTAIWANFSASGEASVSVELTSTAGIDYRGGSWHGVKKKSADVQAELQAKIRAGFDLTVSLDIMAKPIVDASFGVGFQLAGGLTVRSTGLRCTDVSVGAFAEVAVGAHDSLIHDLGLSYKLELLDPGKGGALGSFHMEGMRLVGSCTYGKGGHPDGPDDPGGPANPEGDFEYVIVNETDGYVEGDWVDVPRRGGEGFGRAPYVGPGAYATFSGSGEATRLVLPEKLGDAPLVSLSCSNSGLMELDASRCSSLAHLNCYNNNLSSLDVNGNAALRILECSQNPALSPLDVSDCLALEQLHCNSNNLSSLDVSGNPALTLLYCGNNNLSSLNVGGCAALKELYCGNNNLASLDVGGNAALERLACSGNNLSSLNVGGCAVLKGLYCDGNNLASLDVRGCTALEELHCSVNSLSSLDVSGLTALTALGCADSNLSSLDVGGCTALTSLLCSSNSLSSLDVSGNPALRRLDCSYNSLASLDVSGNPALNQLDCSYSSLASLDVSGNPALEWLSCSSNSLSSLDVGGCTALTSLYCYNNNLTSLDVSGNPALLWLHCYDNSIADTSVLEEWLAQYGHAGQVNPQNV